MNLNDLKYITRLICNMSGIPIRIYKKNILIDIHSLVKLVVDPIILDIDDINKITDNIGYHINTDFYYYGIINYKDYKIVIGPSRHSVMNKQELKIYALKLGVKPNDTLNFISSIETISYMPLPIIIQMLCSINFTLNKEKKNINDIIIDEQISNNTFVKYTKNKNMTEENSHNTLLIEQKIMNLVENGNVPELIEWSKKAPAINSGRLSNDQIRQFKNTFVVTTTLVSRSAIKGGMTTNDAFTLSDLYIQKCELLNKYSEIINLQYNMVLDFTKKVADLKILNNNTKLYYDVTNYINHHLSEPIKIDDIAISLKINRSYLSTLFKKTTGRELSNYIFEVKIKEAKNLLLFSDNSIDQISYYLGFANRSHFSKTFKKYTSLTPKQYQIQNKTIS